MATQKKYLSRSLPLEVRLRKIKEKKGGNNEQQNLDNGNSVFQKWKNHEVFQNKKVWHLRLDILETNEHNFQKAINYRNSDDPEVAKLRIFLRDILSTPKKFRKKHKFKNFFQNKNSLLQAIPPLKVHMFRRFWECINDINFSHSRQINKEKVAKYYFKKFARYTTEELFPSALVTELKYAKEADLLEGDNSTERFWDFCLGLTAEPEWINYFFEEYPVLLRRYWILLNNILSTFENTLLRIDENFEEIIDHFGLAKDDELIKIEPFKGDLHRQGQSVHILHFESGGKVVYKPRSLAPERQFYSLVKNFTQNELEIDFKIPKILTSSEYGWMEFIEFKACQSQEEVERFYFRHGIYLALLNVLGGTDVLEENVIAYGEYPILIDLECITTPSEAPTFIKDDRYKMDNKVLSNSVINTLMLPHWSFGNIDDAGIKTGALAVRKGQKKPEQPVWVNIGTDEMRKELKSVETDFSDSHVPRLQNEIQPVLQHKESLIKGFKKGYNLLLENKGMLSSKDSPFTNFEGIKVRYIVKATNSYYQLKLESLHPDYCESALDTNILYENLWIPILQSNNKVPSSVIQSEINQMWNEDIPYFFTYSNSTGLWDDKGNLISQNYFSDTCMEGIRWRISRLSKRDLDYQINLIEQSLSLLGDKKDYSESNSITVLEKFKKKPPKGKAKFYTQAENIAEKICYYAIEDQNSVGWIGLNMAPGGEWRQSTLKSSFYDGTNGIALFLAYIGKILKVPKYKNFATKIAKRSVYEFKNFWSGTSLQHENDIYVGLFRPPLDTLYLLTHLDSLFNTSLLDRDLLNKFFKWLEPRIYEDDKLDFMHGVCGVIKLLIDIDENYKSSRALDLADKCGQHLVANAIKHQNKVSWDGFATRLGGFGHGTSSYSWILFMLSDVTNREIYRELALKALAYDRSTYLPEKKAWKDLRYDDGIFATSAWCHGSAGIGLGRLLSLKYYSDELINEELHDALVHIKKQGLGITDCICHGDLGNVEILFGIANYLDDEETSKNIINYVSNRLDQVMDGGDWVCAYPRSKVDFYGMFPGLAGIGYNLLRLSNWQTVPSVLCLESPECENEILHSF